MPYLIYGEDTYRSRQKLNAIKSKYIDSSLGDTNLAQIDGAKTKGDEIIRQLWIAPFLAPKRLVIIHNLVSLGAKDAQTTICDFLPKIPPSTVAVFYENEKIDKRNALFKALNQPKYAEEYAILDPIKLNQWITKQFTSASVKIDRSSADFLIKNIGPDLWRLQNEIDKLILYSPEGVTIEKIKEIVHIEPTGDVFQLIDALARRDIKTATLNLKGRLAAGDSPIYLLSMFIYGFRTLLIVKDLLERDPRATSASGIHPLVWRKTRDQINNFSLEKLRSIYDQLKDLDYAIKTGIIDPEAALDLFVFEICIGSKATSKKPLTEGMNEQMAARQRII